MKQTKDERKASQQGYRQSPLGRMASKRASERRSEKRRLIAAAKPGRVVTARPRVYDSKSVQQTLMQWGG